MPLKNIPSLLRLEPNNFTFNVWGGQWIPRLKNLRPSKKNVGESWEFSDHREHPNQTRLNNGRLISLSTLFRKNAVKILGRRVVRKFGFRSPFLAKFIDAKKDLSLQVHPSEKYARKYERDSGKAESWLILETGSKNGEGHIYIGFKGGKSLRKDFNLALGLRSNKKKVLSCLNKVRVKPGQIYHVYPGAIHAIGKGVRLFEIQQTSNLTYRIWDWNRKPARPLHLEKAFDVLDFTPRSSQSFRGAPRSVHIHGRGKIREQSLIKNISAGFAVHQIVLGGAGDEIWQRQKDRFAVFTVIKGTVVIVASEGAACIPQGHSVMIPAFVERCVVRAMTEGAVILKSFVP